jgi:hypothetical protein
VISARKWLEGRAGVLGPWFILFTFRELTHWSGYGFGEGDGVTLGDADFRNSPYEDDL